MPRGHSDSTEPGRWWCFWFRYRQRAGVTKTAIERAIKRRILLGFHFVRWHKPAHSHTWQERGRGREKEKKKLDATEVWVRIKDWQCSKRIKSLPPDVGVDACFAFIWLYYERRYSIPFASGRWNFEFQPSINLRWISFLDTKFYNIPKIENSILTLLVNPKGKSMWKNDKDTTR